MAEKNILSRGSGNDKLFGDKGANAIFGGPRHDYLAEAGVVSDATLGSDVIYKEGGDDVLVAAIGNSHELS